jgi:uncharacterized membrane protein
MVTDEQRMQELESRTERLEARIRQVERSLPGRSAPNELAAPPVRRSVPPPPAPPRRQTDRPAATPPPFVPRRPATEARLQDLDLEQFLGGRVLAWVGGAAVISGLALLLALGMSQGWIGVEARTLMAGGLSLALLWAGTWLHERHGRAQAAQATIGTALCGLFMTLIVAAPVYHLMPVGVALVLAFVTGALATGLAVRWSAPVIGALGITGAVLAPILVQAPATGATIAFEAIAVASAVVVLLRERWDWLALGVFVVSAPQWLSWLADERSAWVTVGVLCLFGGLYAAAALGFELRMPSAKLRPASAFLLGLNALTLSVAGWFLLNMLGEHDLAVGFLVVLAAVHAAAGLAGRRSPRVSNDIGLLCLTLAVVLADVAFSLTVGGPARTVGFAAAGVAFALLLRGERRGNDTFLSELGLGGHIALSALQALRDVDVAQLLSPGAAPGAVAGLVAVAAGCLVSARLAEAGRPQWRVALDVTGLAATAVVALLTLDGAALTVAWAAQAVALARIAVLRDDPIARTAAMVHLVAAGVFALGDQAAPAGLLSGGTELGPAALGLGALAAASGACARVLQRTDPAIRTLTAAVPAVLLYLASLTVVALSPAALDGGAVQQGQLQLSALWSLAGVGTLLLGLSGRSRPLRLAGLGLLGLTAAKVFLYDLAALTSVYRVGSFLGLGLLLLLAAMAYQRMRPEPLGAGSS